MIKACIFDLDGTLLNTLPTIKHYLNGTLGKFGYAEVSCSDTKRYIGDGAYMLIKRALGEQGESDEEKILEALSDYKAAYDASPLYLTEIYEGVPEMLRDLKNKGIHLAVLSNKPDPATVAVVSHFFGDLFDIVRGGIDGIPLKPDATSALDILEKMNVTSAEAAFIGDTSVDIETAKNMCASLSVGVLWGFREKEELSEAGADLICSRAEEITSHIGERNE